MRMPDAEWEMRKIIHLQPLEDYASEIESADKNFT